MFQTQNYFQHYTQRKAVLLFHKRNKREDLDIFDIPYYKMLQKYLQLLGQDPHQSNEIRKIILIVILISGASVFIPTSIEVFVSLRKKDMDAVIECLPHLIATATSMVKLLNIYIYRQNFKKMFDFISKEWERLKFSDELHVLEEVTLQGSKVAHLYRNTLLSFMSLFLIAPLIVPMLDIVLPLNETRPRQQLLRVNYLIFDEKEYFFYIYFQLFWAAIAIVLIIVTVDSLYILIIHHTSGLLAVCGYQIQKVTENPIVFSNEADAYKQFRNCIIAHDRAIQFYDILNESSRFSYLIQVGLNMMGISVTAVQTVANFGRPEEAIRTAVFLGAEQFHLFVISLPGQVLLDHCSTLSDNIYSSTWYNIPVKAQKMLHTMQIRSKKACSLTAGGLYEMNMENFGITFKTCMSYFTMLMSLRE
ncbi:unnamed protein product [Xylocopa violacea]|uniref:Odorant receptor n=1 Tax=Xylocopa violacea TaxID=135666 RepID=A0ABP1NKA1_XYLVO